MDRYWVGMSVVQVKRPVSRVHKPKAVKSSLVGGVLRLASGNILKLVALDWRKLAPF